MVTVTLSRVAGREHLALAAEAGALLDGETGCLERFAYGSGNAPRRERGIRGSEARHRAQYLVRPHVGIFRRREAVQVNGIGGKAQVAKLCDIGEEKREHYVAELEAMRPADEERPAGVQLGRFAGELRIQSMQRAQIFEPERVLFDRDEMQAPATRRIFLPRAPRGEEIESHTETGLEDDEALA